MTLATQVQAAIEKYCNTEFAATATVQYFDGGFPELIVKVGPIISITSLLDMDATAVGSAVASTVYDFDPLQGMVYKKEGGDWSDSKSRRRWKLSYSGGYASIPENVQLAIDMWVDYLTSNASGAVKSYTTGDDSETYFDLGQMPAQVKTLIAPYKRMIFWH